MDVFLSRLFFSSVRETWALSKGTVFPFRMSIIKSVYLKLGASCIVKAGLCSYLSLCRRLEPNTFYSPLGLRHLSTISQYSKMVTPTQFLRLCFLLIVCLIRK